MHSRNNSHIIKQLRGLQIRESHNGEEMWCEYDLLYPYRMGVIQSTAPVTRELKSHRCKAKINMEIP